MIRSHELELVKTMRSGAQVWRCPICGHWVIKHLAGEQSKSVVLCEGNKAVTHYTSSVQRAQANAQLGIAQYA
jgi:hypothetical protein